MASIGIDFGTTYCTVAAYKDEKVIVIPNDHGKLLTPSYVAFTDVERIYGDAAINQSFVNMENTVYGIKQLLGRCTDDQLVGVNKEKLGFQIADYKNKPYIPVKYTTKQMKLNAEQICAMMLSHMKNIAEKHLHEPVVDAVVSVPSDFCDAQRRAVKDAGVIAGLNVKALINETTAAAITFGSSREVSKMSNVLVFDLGGGCFDVSVVSIKDSVFNVLSSGGYNYIGGNNFDDGMVEHFRKRFLSETDKDVSKDKKALNRLRVACEKAKRTLSGIDSTSVRVDGFVGKTDFVSTITREEFEAINKDLFEKIMDMVNLVIYDAKKNVANIDEIILVGGSTRIPKIREMLSELFNGKELNRSINPDEAVAYGAAIMCDNLVNKRYYVSDVTFHSTGVMVETRPQGGDMYVGIHRGTDIPANKWVGLSSYHKGEETIAVYEGHSNWVKENILTCKMKVNLHKGRYEVHFFIDNDGLLTTQVIQKNQERKAYYLDFRGRLSDEELEQMAADHQKFEMSDAEWKEQVDARNTLENFTYAVKQATRDRKYRSLWKEEDKNAILKKSDHVLLWIQDNGKAKASESHKKHEDLANAWIAVLSKMDPDKADQLKQREEERKKQIEERKVLKERMKLYQNIAKDPNYKESSSWPRYLLDQASDKIKHLLFNNSNPSTREIEQALHEADNAVDPYYGKPQNSPGRAQYATYVASSERGNKIHESIEKVMEILDKNQKLFKSDEIRQIHDECNKLKGKNDTEERCKKVSQILGNVNARVKQSYIENTRNKLKDIRGKMQDNDRLTSEDRSVLLSKIIELEQKMTENRDLEELETKYDKLEEVWNSILDRIRREARSYLNDKLRKLTTKDPGYQLLSDREKSEVFEMIQFAEVETHSFEEYEGKRSRLLELCSSIETRKNGVQFSSSVQQNIGHYGSDVRSSKDALRDYYDKIVKYFSTNGSYRKHLDQSESVYIDQFIKEYRHMMEVKSFPEPDYAGQLKRVQALVNPMLKRFNVKEVQSEAEKYLNTI